MKHMDLIHTCTNPRCLEEQGIEAQTEERDGRVHVRCGLCGRRRDYPTDALNRTSTGPGCGALTRIIRSRGTVHFRKAIAPASITSYLMHPHIQGRRRPGRSP